MNKILIATMLVAASTLTHAQTDRDNVDDELRYVEFHDTKKNVENYGHWNSEKPDRAGDNVSQWDASRETRISFSIVTESGIPTMLVKIAI